MNFSSVVLVMALGAACTAMAADAKAEEQLVGPIADKAKYIVSPRGVHLATVAPKGSRVNVIVDGVAGPRFDDVVETTFGYIDPRPYVAVDPNLQPHGAAVVFSRDGNRYAYLARLGQEWVLMADNKEVLRLPVAGAVGATSGIAGNEGNTDVRIEFSGESGKHLLFARSTYAGYELWVDGQKWPGFFRSGGGGGEGTIDPIISADGEHIAYVAQVSREKQALIVDGKDAGYFAGHLQFTADSKHLISQGESPKGQAVLVDGKSLFAARQILNVYVPPVGNRLIFSLVHFSQDGSRAEGGFLLVDGKPVEATLTKAGGPTKVIISPDGKHYAAICGGSPNQFVVIDGKKGQEYFLIDADSLATLQTGITFSPDSSKVVYTARSTTGGQFVVVNDEESDALGNAWFQFSADGKHLAFGGMIPGAAQKTLLSIDGKTLPLPPGWFVSSFTFSPDGSRYAFLGQQGGNKGIFLDGKNTEMSGEFAFSPDSKHFVVAGFKPAENKAGFFVDGQLVFETYDKPLLQRGFTPDSQHLVWMSREPAIGARAAPGVMDFVVYVDGVSVQRCDRIMDAQGNVRNLYGYSPTLWRMPAAWNTTTAGALTYLGPVDDGIKRFTVAAPAGTSVETMIAEAKAAPARAAAKAAEEKKKAADEAAAKKAKADADAAEAAAKAKADYDAAVAKRKADYDAAVAKRQADYAAAVAKKKADYDAAVAARQQQLLQQQKK